MSDDKMDAIVVGAGLAGSAAALTLARAGKQVVLVERGPVPGSKNMTGGRLYTHALARLLPETWKEAPLERRVTRELVSMLTEEGAVTVDYSSRALADNSFTVLRARLDPWLAEQAEAAGAMVAAGVKVDDLLLDGGKVVGVRAGGDDMLADVVIVAEGVNCLLPRQAGLRTAELDPHHVAVGVKTTIELPRQTIEDRFHVTGDDGAAQLFVGSLTRGMQGGGFLYTNRESVSLGLVITVAAVAEKRGSPAELMEAFKQHPSVAPLIDGGKVVEYSAHLVPEGGLRMMPELVGDGILVAGDAAGLVLNLGYTVRGMDYALASGAAAAEAALLAMEKGEYGKQSLGVYVDKLRQSFVLRELEFYRDAPAFMDSTPRVFGAYPEVAAAMMKRMFTVDGVTPPTHVGPLALDALKGKASLWQVGRDAWKGGQAL
jgi:electron transfer flavoprotein-quinone oxidoreductase